MRLIYFSPVPAGSYAQRPHFMVRAWLDWGVESVLWVNPYPCRLPQLRDVHRLFRRDDQGTPADSRVRVLEARALPIEPLPWGPWLNRRLLWRKVWRTIEQYAAGGLFVLGIGRPSAMTLAALRTLRPAASFFDAMDDFPEFHRGLSRRAMRRHEDAIAAGVDLIVASSTLLAEKFGQRGLRVERVLNACEAPRAEGGRRMTEGELDGGQCEMEGKSEILSLKYDVLAPPSALRPPPSPPVLGYVGCIGHWFDWALVMRLAEALPQARIELIGPCVVAPPQGLPANVRLLPACRQSESARHLAQFSAGLVPFRCNALTAGVDPIKYYEYRAAGLPVLSTSFGEMAHRGRDDGVYFLDRTDDLAGTVAAALSHCCDAAEVSRFRRQNNWTSRFRKSDGFRSLWPAPQMRRAA